MKRLFSFLLTVCFLLPLVPVTAHGSIGETEVLDFKLNGIDTECRTGQMVAYTAAGKATGTSDGCTEVTVGADGRILAVGGHNNTVPEGGFILAGNGTKGKQLQALNSGDGIWLDKEKLTVTVVPQTYRPFYAVSIPIDALNGTRKQDTVVLYNSTYGKATTETNAWGFEVTVDETGFVSQVGGNDSAIPAGGFVLSGHGTGKTLLEGASKSGMKASLSDDFKTVTLAFDSDAALEVFLKELEQFRAEKADAEAHYRLLDANALKNAEETLNALYAEIESALSAENYLLYVVKSRSFSDTMATAMNLLIEENPVEARGVWLRPALTADRSTIFKTVESIWNAGFNQVYLELLFDNTTVMPMPEDSLYTQNPAFADSDPLALYIEACHSYGLEIHAWMSVFRVGYKGSSNTIHSIGTKKPEWLNLSKNGLNYVTNVYGDAFFLNPALPEVQSFLLESYAYIVQKYDLDGFQLDYVRYPNKADGEEFGYDDYTVNLFAKQYGKDPRTLAENSADYTAWCEFRAAFVTDFVKKVHDMLAKERPDMYLGAAVAPGYSTTIRTMNQDSAAWMEEGLIDIVFPMAYGTTDAVTRYIEETVPAAGSTVYTCIGVSDQGGDIFREQILASRTNSTDGIAFFSWNVYDERYAAIADGIFAHSALSPTYNGKAAMLARLALIEKRIETKMKADFPALAGLSEMLAEEIEALENSTLSSRKAELTALLDELQTAANDLEGNASAVLTEDCRMAYKLLNSNRDDAKAEYLKTHPLPDSLLPEESRNESDTSEGAESTLSEEEQNKPALSPVEKFFQVFSMVIIFGGLALFPLYLVLNRKRKRDAQAFEKNTPDDQDTQGE